MKHFDALSSQREGYGNPAINGVVVMAIGFGLLCCVGRNDEAAIALENHFASEQDEWLNWSGLCLGTRVLRRAYLEMDWIGVSFDGVTQIGIQGYSDERQLSGLGWLVYARLRAAPRFEYAMLGLDSDWIIDPIEEWIDTINIGDRRGLVFNDSYYPLASRVNRLLVSTFRPGYSWYPYKGDWAERQRDWIERRE